MVNEQQELLHNKLLTLPKSDFPSLQIQNQSKKRKFELGDISARADIANANDNATADVHPPLLLLSLPPSLKISDLSSSEFILPEEENDSGNGNDDDEHRSRCRLINESKGVTFDLIKVESSNAYVMFPPPSAKKQKLDTAKGGAETSRDDDKNNGDNKIMLQGRLLRENNTFFMECELPKSNLEQLVSKHLAENCIYPPSKGASIPELSAKFQYSQKEVKQVLTKVQAFQIPIETSCSANDSANNGDNDRHKRYGILSEEIERETWNNIISVLAEWDGGMDYAQKGVILDEMVKIVMSKDESMEKGLVRYCLDQCAIYTSDYQGC